jgi:hypothetical protein
MSTQSTGPPTGAKVPPVTADPNDATDEPLGPRYMLIRPDGLVELGWLPPDDQGQARVVNELVGGYYETIGWGPWLAFINEDGKRLQLPPNTLAEVLARQLGWQFRAGDYLVGPAVFASRAGFSVADVPEGVVDLARELGMVGQ